MAMRQYLSSILLLLISTSTTTLAQPLPAPVAAPPLLPVVAPPLVPVVLPPSLPPVPSLPPTPPPPPPPPPRPHADIIKVLQKAGDFTVLIRLLRNTHVADEINSQLGDKNGAITFFAPTDSAFARLKSGTLNTLTTEKQVELMQFHAIPTYLSMTQFQTVSNPLMTNAGGSDVGDFPLNVTTSGDDVSVFTGVNAAKVVKTIYADKELAVYEVDKVLQPMKIFSPSSAAALAPEKPKADKEPDSTPITTKESTSNAETLRNEMAVSGIVTVGFLVLVASATL